MRKDTSTGDPQVLSGVWAVSGLLTHHEQVIIMKLKCYHPENSDLKNINNVCRRFIYLFIVAF